MYSTKKNVLQVVASLKAYGIDQIVLSPGSRNAPLTHTFTQHPFFNCHLIVDERSAAFFALGLIQKLRRPVAICCTSGTALLNYAPAIAEAYYQQLPLIVISADRSPAWIGQMDGQTVPQNNTFATITKKFVQLPEISNSEDEWYCQRLIHEAILCTEKQGKGPVHINVPISEPLFDFSEKELRNIQPIQYTACNKSDTLDIYTDKWLKYKKRMIVVGQLPQNNRLTEVLEQLAVKYDCVILGEHLSNISSSKLIGNFDTLLHTLNENETLDFRPDLLINFGGHVVSKKIKHFLRKNKAKENWLLTDTGELVDLYQSLTDLVQVDAEEFLRNLLSTDQKEQHKTFSDLWENKSKAIAAPISSEYFSDLSAVKLFMESLPANAALHLANSSSVRNAQLFPLDKSVQVFCNRGTNGIDGTVSTAAGFARVHDGLTFLLIGDLSFFYDLNILCYDQLPSNLRILLINNGGGNIFHQLPGLDKSEALTKYIAAGHCQHAEKWVKSAELEYISASNQSELIQNMPKFVSQQSQKAIVMEVFTSIENNASAMKEYYNNLKK